MPLQHNPEIMVTRMTEEIVLLDPSTREIFTLNETGALVWDNIELERDAIASRVCDAFDIDRPTAVRDVDELMAELLSRGLAQEV